MNRNGRQWRSQQWHLCPVRLLLHPFRMVSSNLGNALPMLDNWWETRQRPRFCRPAGALHHSHSSRWGRCHTIGTRRVLLRIPGDAYCAIWGASVLWVGSSCVIRKVPYVDGLGLNARKCHIGSPPDQSPPVSRGRPGARPPPRFRPAGHHREDRATVFGRCQRTLGVDDPLHHVVVEGEGGRAGCGGGGQAEAGWAASPPESLGLWRNVLLPS